MEKTLYSNMQGIKTKQTPIEAPQVAFLKAENAYVNKELGAVFRRGGSVSHSVTGNILGIGGYKTDTGNYLVPTKETVLRYRRDGSNSYLEKLDYEAGTWSALTLGSDTSFGTNGIASFYQANSRLVILAGRPAYLDDISGTVARLGGPAPTAAPTLTSPGGTTLTGTYRYFYTFYNATTGWESSPSPISSAITVAAKDITLSALETSVTKSGVGHKRIYRTIGTNEAPFRFVAQITLATTSYVDAITDLNLGEAGPDISDQDPPPSDCYIGKLHKSRNWIASGSELWYSLPDDGTGVPLEHFSITRVERFPARITGLARAINGDLLIFLPPGSGIYRLSGSDEDSFAVELFAPNRGTYFHKSIAEGGENQELIGYWDAFGPRFIGPSGVTDEGITDIENLLYEASISQYNSGSYVWGVWDRARKNFVFGLSLSDTDATNWIFSGTSLPASWINSDTLEPVAWG